MLLLKTKVRFAAFGICKFCKRKIPGEKENIRKKDGFFLTAWEVIVAQPLCYLLFKKHIHRHQKQSGGKNLSQHIFRDHECVFRSDVSTDNECGGNYHGILQI